MATIKLCDKCTRTIDGSRQNVIERFVCAAGRTGTSLKLYKIKKKNYINATIWSVKHRLPRYSRLLGDSINLFPYI